MPKAHAFGCGLAQCGACTVHLGGEAIRSCITPVSAAASQPIATLDGLAETYTKQKGLSEKTLHPVQQAFIAVESDATRKVSYRGPEPGSSHARRDGFSARLSVLESVRFPTLRNSLN